MKIEKLSKKQKQIFRFAHHKDYAHYEALICDGAVRSGKTVVMTLSFVLWAMRYFNKCSFGICSKTISSAERNIVATIKDSEDLTAYFDVSYNQSKHLLKISSGENENYFYIFGGKDSSSYTLIQGLTLCGVFFDEVALLPKNFVEQGIARTLSVKKAKLWFNCNPEHPEHWFYKEWILDALGENKKKILHLKFKMQDNPILSDADIRRAESLYTGIFKERYIYGKWVAPEGLVYSMFSDKNKISRDVAQNYVGEYFVSIDYGTVNPFSMGLWIDTGSRAIRLKEFYFDSKEKGRNLTDEQYYNHLVDFCKGYQINRIIVDPSAASFIQTIRHHKTFKVVKAKNDVLDGIRLCSDLIRNEKILIAENCKDILREFSLYRWDLKSEKDTVVKEFDHALDEMRYFCSTILSHKSGYKSSSAKISKPSPKKYYEMTDFVNNWGDVYDDF